MTPGIAALDTDLYCLCFNLSLFARLGCLLLSECIDQHSVKLKVRVLCWSTLRKVLVIELFFPPDHQMSGRGKLCSIPLPLLTWLGEYQKGKIRREKL